MNENSNFIKKKGIPSEYALFLDKSVLSKIERNEPLSLGDLLKMLFHSEYQQEYYRIASKLLVLLLEKKTLRSNHELKDFIAQEKIFKEVLYSRIIYKLERFGIIEKERKEKVRGKPFSIKISNRFSEIMKNISEQWYMQYMLSKTSER
ncbi:MAG: hypothetical protein QXY62_04025 [Candidatus Altiarchaeota archaeon]